MILNYAADNGAGAGGAPSTTIRMNHPQILTMIDTMRNESATITAEIEEHVKILSTMTSNPHMQGSIQSVELVLDRCRKANTDLQTCIEEMVKVIQVAEVLGTELEMKFAKLFQELAGDSFTTDATLDTIQAV